MRVERVTNCCGSRGSLNSVDFQPHATSRSVHRIATASTNEVRIWALWRPEGENEKKDTATKCVCLFTFKGHAPHEVAVARWSPNGRYLASTDSGGVTHIIERDEEKTRSLEKYLDGFLSTGSKDAAALLEEQKTVTKETRKYTFKYDGTAAKKTKTGGETAVKPSGSKANRISFESHSVHQEVVKPTPAENTIENFEIWSPLQPITCPTKMGQLFDISWAPDNRSIVGGGLNGQVAVFDIHTKQVVAKFDAFEGIYAENAYNVRGYVKSVAWDPMTLYVAIQTSNRQVSLWRRSPLHQKSSSHKWTFKRVLHDDSLFQKTQNDTLGGCRISWTPNGQAISFPNAGVGNSNFAACYEVLHADVSRNKALMKDGKLDRSKLQFAYDIADHTVRQDPLLLQGHSSRVRNVRFSQDLLVSYKRGLCKGGTFADSDRFIFYAQTSDDGMISIWRFKQSSNWYSHYKNEAQCICVLHNVTDEQSSMEDLSWGNSGKWLAIATSQGGLILIEMGEEETFTRYRSNWLLGLDIEDKDHIGTAFLDKVEKYIQKREESSATSNDSHVECIQNDDGNTASCGMKVPEILEACNIVMSSRFLYGPSNQKLLQLTRFPEKYHIAAFNAESVRFIITSVSWMKAIVELSLLRTIRETAIGLLVFVHASVTFIMRRCSTFHTMKQCGYFKKSGIIDTMHRDVGYILCADSVSMRPSIDRSEYKLFEQDMENHEDLFEDVMESMAYISRRRLAFRAGSSCNPRQMSNNLTSSEASPCPAKNILIGGICQELTPGTTPEECFARLCEVAGNLFMLSTENSNDVTAAGNITTPPKGTPKEKRSDKPTGSGNKQPKKPKRSKKPAVDDPSMIDIWLNMDYSNAEELLAEYWKNYDTEVQKETPQSKKKEPLHLTAIVETATSTKMPDMIDTIAATPDIHEEPKPEDMIEKPKNVTKKPNKIESIVAPIPSDKEKRQTGSSNLFSAPSVKPVLCVVLPSGEGSSKVMALNNLNDDVPSTLSCIESESNAGFKVKWIKNIPKGYVTHVSTIKSHGLILVVSQIGELLHEPEGPLSLKRKRWSDARSIQGKHGDKGINKRHINQERVSAITLLDCRTGNTVMEPCELPDVNISSIYAFCSGDRIYLALTVVDETIYLYAIDGKLESRSLKLRFILESKIGAFLQREKYSDIMQIQMLNVTLNSATDGRLQWLSNIRGEASSPLRFLRCDAMSNDSISSRNESNSSYNRRSSQLSGDLKKSSIVNGTISDTCTPLRFNGNPLGGLLNSVTSDPRSRHITLAPLDNGISLDSEPDNNMYAIVVYMRYPDVYVITKHFLPVHLKLEDAQGQRKAQHSTRSVLSLRAIRDMYRKSLKDKTENMEEGTLFSSLVNRLVDLFQLNHLIADKYNSDSRNWDNVLQPDEDARHIKLMESALILGSRSEYIIYLYEYVQSIFARASIKEIQEVVATLYKTLIQGGTRGWDEHRVKLSCFDARMMDAIGVDVVAIIHRFILPLLRSAYDVICAECGRRNLYIVDEGSEKETSNDQNTKCHLYCNNRCPIDDTETVITDATKVDDKEIVMMYQTCGELLKKIGIWDQVIAQF